MVGKIINWLRSISDLYLTNNLIHIDKIYGDILKLCCQLILEFDDSESKEKNHKDEAKNDNSSDSKENEQDGNSTIRKVSPCWLETMKFKNIVRWPPNTDIYYLQRFNLKCYCLIRYIV